MLASVLAAPSASADEPGETDVGYLLVQQALAHLAHDSSPEGVAVALEKAEDALETDDHEGVDVPTLEQAVAALEADDIEGARQVLQESIADTLHNQPPATGMESGTTTSVVATRIARLPRYPGVYEIRTAVSGFGDLVLRHWPRGVQVMSG